jgi:hypothetical protein
MTGAPANAGACRFIDEGTLRVLVRPLSVGVCAHCERDERHAHKTLG